MESVCRVQSVRLKRMPRMFSSHRGPSLVAHWNALLTCSLISRRYWMACVTSTTTLAPSVSGTELAILDILAHLFWHRLGLQVDTVVLVRRLGQ